MSTRGPTEVGKEYRVPRSQFRPGNEAIVTMTGTEGAPESQWGWGPDISPGGVSSLTETGEQQQQQRAYHCQVGLCSAGWKLGTCKINAYEFLLLQSTIFIYIAEMALQNWLRMNQPGLWIHNRTGNTYKYSVLPASSWRAVRYKIITHLL